MKTTKFYVYEARKQEAPGKLIDMIRHQISYVEAVKLDDEYGEALKKLEETFPSVKKQFDELDAEAITVGKEVTAFATAKSPKVVEAQKALAEIISRRDMIMGSYQLRHNELILNKEALTKTLINEQAEEWRARRISLSQTIEVTETKEKPDLFEKSDFVTKTNRAALRKVLDFLMENEIALRNMAGNSLRGISEFIKTVEAQYSELDPTLMESETLKQDEYKYLKEVEVELKTPVKNPQTVYDTGRKDYKGDKEFIKVKGGK